MRHVCLFINAGILQAEYSKTNRIPVSERRQVSGDPIEQESMSVLPVQEMPHGRHVQGLWVPSYLLKYTNFDDNNSR